MWPSLDSFPLINNKVYYNSLILLWEKMNLLQSYKIERDENLCLIVIASCLCQGMEVLPVWQRKEKQKEKVYDKGFCKVQVSLMSLGGDIGDVQGNEALDTSRLASLLYSRNDKLDEKI